jgi:N-methylhydantoinase A
VARRSVYHGAARGRADTAIYAGADLELGCRLDGPLLVEEVTTTVYVGPDDVLEVDNANNFVIHLVPRKATHGH